VASGRDEVGSLASPSIRSQGGLNRERRRRQAGQVVAQALCAPQHGRGRQSNTVQSNSHADARGKKAAISMEWAPDSRDGRIPRRPGAHHRNAGSPQTIACFGGRSAASIAPYPPPGPLHRPAIGDAETVPLDLLLCIAPGKRGETKGP
jgi:hypothetical protein